MIALATCSYFPNGDADDALLAAALPEARWAVWDDPSVNWSAFDLVVIRSTWDYQERRDEFLEWVRSVPRIVNPPEVIEWNTDKRYLGELPGAVHTEYVAPGESFSAPGGEYVVKPTVSAGSRHTARFGPGEEGRAAALVAEINASGRTAMVQPYLSAIDTLGETALLYFDGAYSHAVRKGPILRPGAEPTGLFNRHGWELLLGREESRCVRYGSAAAVLMAELDACAEELLPRTAEVLSAAVRPSDVVARLEGETFAVLLLECDRATAVRVRDRVERELTAAGVPVAVGVASRGRGVPLQAAAQAACAALAVRRRERQASAEA